MSLPGKARPLAVIREAECIGCTKCIQACPVDAILGSNGKMHTVIAEECIGCKLCLPPCPVDCIDLSPPPSPKTLSPEERRQKASLIKRRVLAREERLKKVEEGREAPIPDTALALKKSYVEEAILRAKAARLAREQKSSIDGKKLV